MSPPPVCTSAKLLMGIILLQWIGLSYLLLHQLSYEILTDDGAHGPAAVVTLPQSKKVPETHQKQNVGRELVTSTRPQFNGIAATLMLNNPKWFQRR
mmetsp:Transcript_12987/g.23872  ORF Transcript_12987/g.23872 Transcript_12987/m.23872 type:complete len:97 (-) Transcript_12987:665-955(-)